MRVCVCLLLCVLICECVCMCICVRAHRCAPVGLPLFFSLFYIHPRSHSLSPSHFLSPCSRCSSLHKLTFLSSLFFFCLLPQHSSISFLVLLSHSSSIFLFYPLSLSLSISPLHYTCNSIVHACHILSHRSRIGISVKIYKLIRLHGILSHQQGNFTSRKEFSGCNC